MNRRQYDKLISLKIGNKRAARSGEFEVEIENGVYNVVSVLMAGIPRERKNVTEQQNAERQI